MTKEGIELGRHLFYEGRLSKDGNYSCGSCHQPAAAFTTFEHDLSHGYNIAHTNRNAPGLFNLAWHKAFRQDGSAPDLASVSLAHITSPVEMGEELKNVIYKLRNDGKYLQLFEDAYGDKYVTADRIGNALSQFMLSMVSANTKYDAMKKGSASFTPQEQNGYQLFQTHCNTCHTEPLFTDYSYSNIGLPANSLHRDAGRMQVTGLSSDSLKFRVPSLRNSELTSYYTHDGRFSTLRNMIHHYRSGVQQSPTLDPLLRNGIMLTDAEIADLVIFLKTLSDTAFIHSPHLQHPH